MQGGERGGMEDGGDMRSMEYIKHKDGKEVVEWREARGLTAMKRSSEYN